MILVLTVISVIVLITVPNIAQKKETINHVGCNALVEVVNSQILLYELDNGEKPGSIYDLIDGEYLTENQCRCPDGSMVSISNGEAVAN